MLKPLRLDFAPLMEHSETLTADALLDALKELEIIYEALGRVGSYAGLLYASDTANPDYQNLDQRVEQRSTEIRNLLLFFEIQWLKADDSDSRPADRRSHAENLQPLSSEPAPLSPAHAFTKPEEKIINEKDNTGRNAFGRLFSEVTSSLTFALEKDGKKEDLNLSQVLSLLHEPDRMLRQRAMDILYDGLSQHGQVLTFIYDTLIQDHLTMDHLRHYSHPMVQRHLFNEIDGAAVDTMMQVSGIELRPWPRLLQAQSPTAWPSRPRFVRPVRAGGQGGQTLSVRASSAGNLGSLWGLHTGIS